MKKDGFQTKLGRTNKENREWEFPEKREMARAQRWRLCCASRKQDHGQGRGESLLTAPGSRKSYVRRPGAPGR